MIEDNPLRMFTPLPIPLQSRAPSLTLHMKLSVEGRIWRVQFIQNIGRILVKLNSCDRPS